MSDSTISSKNSPNLEKFPDATEPQSASSAPGPQEPPDGGTKAWLTVAGASAGLFVSFGWCNCIGLFQAQYEGNQLKEYTSSQVSWITSAEFFFMLVFSTVAGKLFDSYGPTVPLLIGSFMHVFGLMMASLSSEYYQFFLSQSVCSGIGTSLIFTPSMTTPQTFFKKKRGIAGGLTVAGSSLGGVIFPLMVQHLIPDVGFPWTMRTCAFLIFTLLVFANLTVSSNFPHKPRPISIMDYIGPLGEPNFAILAVASFFMYWGLFVPFDEIVIAAHHYGMSQYMAFSLVPILNGASFIGRTVPNIIADKAGRFNVMVVMTLASGILCLALWLPGRSNGASIAFAILFGITSGAVVGIGPVLIAGISPLRELGTRMGTILAIAAIGTLTAPPIGTAIAQKSGGDYTFSALFAGVDFIVAGLGVWILRTRISGWGLTTKA
ncbi:hypothetical protein ACLMJK_009441 [Lecanora helva]